MAIAVDLGGTSAKVALAARPARLLLPAVFPTGRRLPVRTFVRRVRDHVVVLRQEARRRHGVLVGVGIGVPGLIEPRRGVVHYLVNIPGWRQVPLKRLVERATGLPAVVDNDVNMMTWGESCWGAGRGARSLLCVALGTGVGGGLVLDGRLYHGWTGAAGEIGHMPLGWDGPRCPCGGRACLERSVGTQAVVSLARRKLLAARRGVLWRLVGGDVRRVTPPRIDQAAYRGDPLARAIWREVGQHLGLALAAVVNLLNPERIVIGGGLAQAGRLLFPAVRATVRARAMRGPSAVAIVPSRWGPQAGLIGAAAMVLHPVEGVRPL